VVSARARTLAACALVALGACRLVGSNSAPTHARPSLGDMDAALAPLREGEQGCVITAGKILVLDSDDTILTPGMLVVRNGRIAAIGSIRIVPAGFELLEFPEGWIMPGLIDLHSHVQTGSWGDINDMVLPINAEFRTSPTIVPGNPNVRRALAGGVTTLFGIPGSGTSMSGFGVLYKTKASGTYEQAVLADPGGLKVAQDSNPQRGAGDLGVSRAGLTWILGNVNDRAVAALELDRFELALENLKKVHAKELPVLIHTAGSDGVANTTRMWRKTYQTRSVLSHGCFDGWKVAAYVARNEMPVNSGPRAIDYVSSREGRVIGLAKEYTEVGVPLFSVNTDAGVVPQEELFLQASMGARYGGDGHLMLRALTIHPARAFGIDGRVGSLEVGKDADLAIFDGDPLDPRSRVEAVLIEGRLEYDRVRDGQRF
jgi:imidazolonepropionase-like amidohydrolase